MSFCCLQFSQKTNENNSTWGTMIVKSNLFVCFLGKLMIPKRHFKINWPLRRFLACFAILSPVCMHCNPVQGQYRARTGFSLWSFPHRENPVFITGNPCSHCRDPCFHYRDFPVRKLHRENPVFITGNGFALCQVK